MRIYSERLGAFRFSEPISLADCSADQGAYLAAYDQANGFSFGPYAYNMATAVTLTTISDMITSTCDFCYFEHARW